MVNFELSYYRYDHHIDKTVKNCGLYDNYLYVGIPGKSIYDHDKCIEITDEVSKHLQKLKDSGTIANYWRLNESWITQDDGKENIVLYYPEDFLSGLNMTMMKGRWFDNASNKGGLIPVVAGYNVAKRYKIGQKFAIDGDEEKYVLIGVLKKNEIFFEANASGTGMDLKSIASDADNMMIVGSDYESATGFSDYSMATIVKTKESDKGERVEGIDKIANLCYTFTFKEIADRAHKDNMYIIRMQGILSLLTLMVCVIGVSCINLLMAVREKKTDSIYMLCGMDKKTAYKIIAIEGIIKGIIPTIAGLAWFFSYTASNGIDEVYTDCWNGIFSLLLIAIVYVFSSLYPIKQISEMSPAEIVTSE